MEKAYLFISARTTGLAASAPTIKKFDRAVAWATQYPDSTITVFLALRGQRHHLASHELKMTMQRTLKSRFKESHEAGHLPIIPYIVLMEDGAWNIFQEVKKVMKYVHLHKITTLHLVCSHGRQHLLYGCLLLLKFSHHFTKAA